MRARRRGCLTTLLVMFLIVVVLAGGAGTAILNTSLDKLGLADIQIPGMEKTVREMGFADLTIKSLLDTLSDLTTVPDTNEIVKEDAKPTQESDDKMVGLVESAGVSAPSDILAGKVVFEEEVEMTLSGGDVSSLMNQIFSDISEQVDEGAEDESIAQMVNDLNLEVVGTNIEEVNGQQVVTTVVTLNVPDELQETLSSLGLPSSLVVQSSSVVEVVDGALAVGTASEENAGVAGIQVNNLSTEQTNQILDAVSEMTGESISSEMLSSVFGDVFVDMMNNLGAANGIENGQVSLTGRTE